MKTRYIALILYLIGTCTLSAQEWTWINPTPPFHTMQDIVLVDERIGYAVGEFGTIIKTTDGGVSWDLLNSGIISHLFAVSFPDADCGYVSGTSGVILKTTDGGESWQRQNVNTSGRFRSISFTDRNNGIAVGDYETRFCTQDGGVTWNDVSGGYHHSKVQLFSDGTAYALDSDGVLQSQDYGKHWQRSTGTYSQTTYDLSFLDSQRGIVTGTNSTILFTSNGGANWESLEYDSKYNLEQIYMIDESIWYGITTADELVRSTDHGTSWQTVSDINTVLSMCNRAYFLNADYGIACGYEGTIVCRTSDGGNHWESAQRGGANRWYEILFFTRDIGMVFGMASAARTTDGGYTWTNIEVPFHSFVRNVWRFDEQNGIVGGENGIMYITSDQGGSWDEVKMPTNQDMQDIHFYNRNRGITAGDGTICLTSDGGYTWDTTYIPYAKFYGAYLLSENVGIAMGRDGRYMQTTDFGATWEMNDLRTTLLLKDIDFANDKVGLMVANDPMVAMGNQGVISRTTNGGLYWYAMVTDAKSKFNSVQFVDSQHAIAVGNNGTVYRSVDAGLTWTQDTRITDNDLESFVLLDRNEGYFVGSGGTILRWENPNPTLIETPEQVTPCVLSIEAISPNPTTGSATVHYSLKKRMYIRLELYNQFGVSVAKLDEGMQHLGIHTTQIKTNGFSSGAYFLRLASGNATATKQITIVK